MFKCPTDIVTIKEAQTWIAKTTTSFGQCKCPVCGQKVKIYPRKLSSALARFLIEIYNLTAGRRPDERWIKVSQELIVQSRHHITRDYSILRFWGLLEKKEKEGKVWRITDSGLAFVEGRLVVPQKAYIYNNYCLRLSETVTDIKGALGSKFHLSEILKREIEYD